MNRNTVPHRLVDQAGREFRASVLFAAGVPWQSGDTVRLDEIARVCARSAQLLREFLAGARASSG